MQFASLIHELVKNHCLIPLIKTALDVIELVYNRVQKIQKGEKK